MRISTLIVLLLTLLSCRNPAPRSDGTASGDTTSAAEGGQPSVTPRADSTPSNSPSSRMAVELLIDATRYRAGADVRLTLVNRTGATYAFNPCMRTVERESGASWTPVREDRMCTMEAWLLDPRGRRTAETDLPDQLEAGRYRLVIALTLEGTPPGPDKPAERVNAVSAPFTVGS